MKKKKMAFIDLTNYKDWPMGGMLEYELAILKYLVKEYDVDIWGVSVDNEINKYLLLDENKYPIHIFGKCKTNKKIIPNYWRGIEILNKKNIFPKDYDIVYAHTGSCLVALNHMIDHKKTKLVYHQHGLNHRSDHSLMSLIQRPGLKIAQKVSNLVFVVSDPESVLTYTKAMNKKTKAKFVSIGSPINLECFDEELAKQKICNREKQQTKNFLYTGRLSAFKDVKTLISAMGKYVNEINDKAVLKVAGSGEELENLKQMVLNLHLENNIKIMGVLPHDEIYNLLQEADIFVTASNGEGVSVSVLEAYASGLPVVCFKVPGLERQVIDGVTGIFAKEKNVDAFYRAMVMADSNRIKMAFNCLKEAKKYDGKYISNKIIEEINKVI